MVESKARTKLTFHKGTHTIGGTLLEIGYGDSRIFFDLGAVFDPELKVSSMDDLLANDLVARVDGLYDPKAFRELKDERPSLYKNQAAFISHAHLDHTSIVNFTDPKLDVYASKDTVKVLEALSVEDDFVFPFAKGQDKTETNIREIRGLSYGEKVEVGEIGLSLIPVDHDAYGACGFLIETPNMKIAYTGDIRSHGLRGDLTQDFIDWVKEPDLLITEGVSFSFYKLGEDDLEENLTESEVLYQIGQVLEENQDRQITFNYYPTNFLRLKELYKRTKGIRKLVLTDFSAYLVKKDLGLELSFYKTGPKSYGLDPKLEISLDDLLMDRGLYLWQVDSKRLNLIDDLMEESLYIHTDAEPLGDYDPAYQVFMDRFARKNIEVRLIKSSGHVPTRDLYQIISKINPKLLAPIHSFNPEWVYYYSDRLLNPSDGDQMLF